MAFYKEHPVFEPPKDVNATIWRYTSFSKFISLLDTSAIYFTVANKFEDKWEGTLPLKNKENMDERIVSFFEQARSTNAVTCWQIRENESATMWKSYTNNSEGIAISSSFARLTQCFKEVESTITCKLPVHIGKVKYIDFDIETKLTCV